MTVLRAWAQSVISVTGPQSGFPTNVMLGGNDGSSWDSGSTANVAQVTLGGYSFGSSVLPSNAIISRVTVGAYARVGNMNRPVSLNVFRGATQIASFAISPGPTNASVPTVRNLSGTFTAADMQDLRTQWAKPDERFTTGSSTNISVDAIYLEVEYTLPAVRIKRRGMIATVPVWFDVTTFKRWNGTAWVDATLHRVGE